MQITGESLNKDELLKGIEPGFISSKKIARNTVKAIYPDNTVIIRYWNTNVITINPDSSIVLNSGGYHTKTTKTRIEENTDLSVCQEKGIWYIWTNRSKPGARDHSMFYDGITIDKNGKITSGIKVSPDKVINQFRKDTGKLVKMITKDNIPLPDSGDCLVCRFDLASHKATPDHLISHVREQYLHGSLIWLCLDLSGFNPRTHIQMKFDDNIRRCVRNVILNTCIPVLMENPELYNGIDKEVTE